MPKNSPWSHLPVSLPEGGLLPHLSARLRTETIDAIFEMSGGPEKMLSWVEKNDANYGEFLKMWARGAVRSSNVEVNAGKSIEDLLERLDHAEASQLIDATAEDITPA